MTRTTRLLRAALALGALLTSTALLAACSAGTEEISAANAADAGEPRRGGVLTYLDAEIPISAQVQESGYWQDRAILQNVLDRLLYRNPETNEIEPWLATSWTVSPDGTRYDFVIRDGVTYSDGTPVDVESVKRNLEWQISGDEETGVSPNPVFPREADITTDAATDTVTVTLPQPYAPLLGVLTTWSAGLVSDATIERPRDEQALFSNLIGSGPFVVTEETYGEKYVLSAREDYAWAPASWENQGAPYLEAVHIVPVQEDAARLGSLKAGQGDLLRYVQPSEEAALAEQGYTVVARSGVGLVNHWFVRQTADYVTDVQVRRAIQHAIDRESIVEDLYTENWSAATGLLSPGTVGYRDRSDLFAYDPERSEALLDEAGWTERDAEGYRTKDGERLTLKTYIDVFDNTARTLFQAIQAQLTEVGIHLDINETDYSSYNAEAWADPEVAVLRTGWPNPDPAIDLYNQYRPGGWNVLNLEESDPTLEDLLTTALTAPSQEAEVEALHAAEDYLLEQAYAIPLLNDSQVYVAGTDVRGFRLTDGGLPEYQGVWKSE